MSINWKLYWIIAWIVCICLNIYYLNRDKEDINDIMDLICVEVECVIESFSWIIAIPIITVLNIFDSIQEIKNGRLKK